MNPAARRRPNAVLAAVLRSGEAQTETGGRGIAELPAKPGPARDNRYVPGPWNPARPASSGGFPGTRKPATRTSRSSPQPRPIAGGCQPSQDRPANTNANMSNATPDTRGTGGERRRQRSRGGKGRNRNRQNQDGSQNSRSQGDRQRGDRGERGPRPPRRDHKPAPLTWWQKLLKAIGLYKEPVRPPRPEKEARVRFEEGPPREVRSNIRNARQQGGDVRPTGAGPAPQRRAPEKTEVASTRIYLGNLSYDATEEDLKDLFKGVGTVRNVEIVYNRRTHKSKGYGFVDMLSVDEAKRSVEVLHDQFFMGRKLVVSGAKTKDHEEGAREEAAEEAAESGEQPGA